MRKTLSGLFASSLMLTVAACGTDADSGEPNNVNANMGAKIGIAMPNRSSERWIADGENIVAQFAAMGYATDLKFGENEVERQTAQIQQMIDTGAKLLVIGAIDGAGLTPVLANAAKAKIPVIAYDRLIRDSPNVSYYATFDNFRVGVLQGNLLAERLKLADGKGPFNVELFAGSPDDNNSKFYYDGAMQVLTPYLGSGQLVVKSGKVAFKDVATRLGDVSAAQVRMTKMLRANYEGARLDAILSPFDGMSVGMIDVLKSNGYGKKGKPLPLITGQDAELASVKSIMAGEQTGTIYKDTRELAKVAVQMGNALLTGAAPITSDTSTYNNGIKVIPTYLLQPIAVDRANYRTLLVDGGYLTEADLS